MERHEIWRRVEDDYAELQRRAPDGHEPVVTVHLAGQEPITLGFVRTRKAADDAWIRFEAEVKGAEGEVDEIPAEAYWVHVHESTILGIEIRIRPKGRAPIGFRYEEIADG